MSERSKTIRAWMQRTCISAALVLATFEAQPAQAKLAQPATYCLTSVAGVATLEELFQVNPTEHQAREKAKARVSFQVKGKRYFLEVSHDQIQLSDDTGRVLQSVKARQFEYGAVTELMLREDGWLWIDGDERDYEAWVNKGGPVPELTQPTQLTQLTSEPCGKWKKFWDGCRIASGHHSPTLQRVFVSGFFEGQDEPVSIEINGRVRKKIHPPVDWIVREVPQMGGVVLRGLNGKAYWHNGRAIQTLPLPPELEGGWMVYPLDASDRVFISSRGVKNEHDFLYEMLAGPTLREIRGRSIAWGWSSFHEFPRDTTVFDIGRHGIASVIDGRWRLLARIDRDDYIVGPHGIRRSADGKSVLLSVAKGHNDALTHFALHPRGAGRCGRVLNPEQPVLIPTAPSR